MIAKTPKVPYYVVIFTSIMTGVDTKGYIEMGEKIEILASNQPGFLGMESARNEIGITVSYWQDLDSIVAWKNNIDHKIAQEKGKSTWYKSYKIRIAKVERDYSFIDITHKD